jgi:hypothetical protein
VNRMAKATGAARMKKHWGDKLDRLAGELA